MKRNFFLFAILLMVSVMASAQRLDITLDDNSVVSFDVSKVKSLEFMPESLPGQISGYWYLGWRVMSSTTTHYDGDEKWIFNGTVLKQVKASGAETVYDLEYAENMKSFKAVPRESGTSYTYSIIANEEGLLVLKRGTSINYHFYKTMTAAHDAETITSFPNRAEYTDTAKVWAQKGGSSHSDKSPMGNKYAKYAAATQEQIEWLANASNQPDLTLADANSEYDRWTAKTINLYPLNNGNPTPADVNQHGIGDCCMCAVFASFAYIYPDFIKSIITITGGTSTRPTSFIVKMYDPQGNPIDVAVDNKLLCNSSGGCVQVSGKNGVFTWSTIMEKALMKWLTCFKTGGLGGIGTEHAAPPFTGDGDSWSIEPGKLFNGELTMVVDYALKNGMISVGGFNVGGILCGTLETVTGHAFTVMYTRHPDKYEFTMRNPWGITEVDGALEIANKREIMKTIDFRLVMPGAAAPYKRQDLGGYIPPKFTMGQYDRFLSPAILKMYNLRSYGPTQEQEDEEEEEE
ncbi:MAG: hypothetical protein J6W52_06365 [Bacteroidaceae bacterium]|nr:hypothetical protein [Bacteroidaceae bacterium]